MQNMWTSLTFLIAVSALVHGKSIVKRQSNEIAIDPILQDEFAHEDQNRDKRHEGFIEPKFGVKNALLGFVFNKLNHFIDQKTAWISQLDRKNIAKNKAAGIEPPADPITSLSGVISGAIGHKLQQAAPLITVVTNKLTSGSGSGSGGFNFGSLLGGFSGNTQIHANAQINDGAHIGVSATGYGGV